MLKDFEKLFTIFNQLEPSPGLLDGIMLRINEVRRLKKARIRAAFFGTVFLAALIALVPAWQEFYAEFTQSGFLQFISLLFSDAGVIASYWQELLISLAESLPVFGISAILASVFGILISLKFLTRDIGIIFRKPNLINI